MKQATLAVLILVAAVATSATPASAALRVDQVALSGGTLQLQINALNTGSINVATQQEDLQRWKKNTTGVASLTLSFELGGNPANNAIGVYNAVADDGVPEGALFEIFPANAEEGWSATATFLDNALTVNLFNASHQLVDQTAYANVAVNDFSFYIQNGQTTGFAQDVLNPGNQARALTFNGTDENEGGWFMCFEDGLLPPLRNAQQGVDTSESQDFDEVILFLEAVRPVPVKSSTWASLKALYR